MARTEKNPINESKIVVSSFENKTIISQTGAPIAKLCTVKNTLRNPLTISYGGEAIRLSPGQSAKKLNRDKLGSLPKGAIIIN